MRIAALVLLVVIAGGGFVGGILLLMDPDGSALGLDRAMLPGWYRGDYYWAGLLLSIGFGLLPAIAAALLFVHPAGWLAVLLVGAGLVVWMLVQILMIGLILPPMQIFFVSIGATLVLLGVRGVADDRRFGRIRTD